METANFSEFSYGFALTHELIVSAPGGVTAAPVFPSLVEEAHVGFDLMIKLRPRTTARLMVFAKADGSSRYTSSSSCTNVLSAGLTGHLRRCLQSFSFAFHFGVNRPLSVRRNTISC